MSSTSLGGVKERRDVIGKDQKLARMAFHRPRGSHDIPFKSYDNFSLSQSYLCPLCAIEKFISVFYSETLSTKSLRVSEKHSRLLSMKCMPGHLAENKFEIPVTSIK